MSYHHCFARAYSIYNDSYGGGGYELAGGVIFCAGIRYVNLGSGGGGYLHNQGNSRGDEKMNFIKKHFKKWQFNRSDNKRWAMIVAEILST